MWYKINKIYVWDDKVRPAVVTETYTIAQQSSTGSASYSQVSVAKAGYKISKLVIETEAQSRGSSYWWNANCVLLSDTQSPRVFYRFALGFGHNNYCRIEYNNGNSTTNGTNMSGYSRYGNNVCTYTMERTWWSSIINWVDTIWTYTSAEETVAQQAMDSQTAIVEISTTQWTNWPATITVTYEPI